MNYDFADQEAERVIKELTETGCGPGCTDWPFIIAEALRKAYREGQEDEAIAYQKVNLPGAFNDGFSAAKEMAAKVNEWHAENGHIPDETRITLRELANKIRALRPEATNGESQSEGE